MALDVLVVDDEADIRDLVAGVLEDEGYAVRTAADTFRPNPAFDCATAITQLGTGEALVSTLEGKGAPSMVERTLVRPPSGRIGPLTDQGDAESALQQAVDLGHPDARLVVAHAAL